MIGADETLERRRGKKIKVKGWYRDAVQSHGKHVVTLPRIGVALSATYCLGSLQTQEESVYFCENLLVQKTTSDFF